MLHSSRGMGKRTASWSVTIDRLALSPPRRGCQDGNKLYQSMPFPRPFRAAWGATPVDGRH
jgi:hypothetical protein